MIKARVKNIITKTVLAALCLAMLIFSCFYLKDIPRGFLLGIIIVLASLGVIIPSIDAVKHESVFKVFVVCAIFVLIFLTAYLVMDMTGLMDKFQDFDAILRFVESTKQWGILVYVGIVIFQVIFLPIPSAIVAIIGTVLFGPLMSFIYMTVGTIVGSILTFMLGKIFGKKLINWMIGAEKTEKYADLLNSKGRFFFIVMMLFPFFPDDIICLVAGVTTMSYRYFITVITLTRPIMIAFMCFFGSGTIIPFSGWGIPIWIGLFILCAALFLLANKIKKKLMQKDSKEVTVALKKDKSE